MNTNTNIGGDVASLRGGVDFNFIENGTHLASFGKWFRKDFLDVTNGWDWKNSEEAESNLRNATDHLYRAISAEKREAIINRFCDVLIVGLELFARYGVDADAALHKRACCNIDRATRAMEAAKIKGTEVSAEWASTQRRISETIASNGR